MGPLCYECLEMKIRTATPKDSRACADVHMLARKSMDYLPQDLHTPEETYTWKRDVVLLHERVWVAEVGHQIVAYASVSDGFLNNLYVLPDHQRRGIGSALLSKVKMHLPGGVRLWTFEPNGAAIRFYERHDFATIERSDGRTNEENVADRLMAWQPEP